MSIYDNNNNNNSNASSSGTVYFSAEEYLPDVQMEDANLPMESPQSADEQIDCKRSRDWDDAGDEPESSSNAMARGKRNKVEHQQDDADHVFVGGVDPTVQIEEQLAEQRQMLREAEEIQVALQEELARLEEETRERQARLEQEERELLEEEERAHYFAAAEREAHMLRAMEAEAQAEELVRARQQQEQVPENEENLFGWVWAEFAQRNPQTRLLPEDVNNAAGAELLIRTLANERPMEEVQQMLDLVREIQPREPTPPPREETPPPVRRSARIAEQVHRRVRAELETLLYRQLIDAQIPSSGFNIGVRRQYTGDRAHCTICMEHIYVIQDVRLLPCNHVFHAGCIDNWLLSNHNTCPYCRAWVLHQ